MRYGVKKYIKTTNNQYKHTYLPEPNTSIKKYHKHEITQMVLITVYPKTSIYAVQSKDWAGRPEWGEKSELWDTVNVIFTNSLTLE